MLAHSVHSFPIEYPRCMGAAAICFFVRATPSLQNKLLSALIIHLFRVFFYLSVSTFMIASPIEVKLSNNALIIPKMIDILSVRSSNSDKCNYQNDICNLYILAGW